MALYTFNGSIPTEIPGGVSEQDHIAAGWKIAPDKPECPEGKEVIWLNWEWVTRDPKPEDREGYVWKWNHDAYQWIEYLYIRSGNTENTVWMTETAETLNVSTNTLIFMITGIDPEANVVTANT